MNIYYDQFSHLSRNEHFFNRYLKLIIKFKERNFSKIIGLEKHHIFPKSFCGTNKKENLIVISPKEHYILHHLLWKAFPENESMLTTFFLMSNKKSFRVTSKILQILTLEMSKLKKGTIWINDGLKQKRIKIENLENYPEWVLGCLPHSLESKNNISKSLTGRIWINNGVIQKQVSKELYIEEFSSWSIGKLFKFVYSENHLNNLSKLLKGRKMINDGVNQKRIFPEDKDKYPDWEFGSLKK